MDIAVPTKYQNQICKLLDVPFVRIEFMWPFKKFIAVKLATAESKGGPWFEISEPYECDYDTEVENGVKMRQLKGKHLLAAINKRIERDKGNLNRNRQMEN